MLGYVIYRRNVSPYDFSQGLYTEKERAFRIPQQILEMVYSDLNGMDKKLNIFEDLKLKDYKILKELDLEDPKKVVSIYAKRIALYKKFADRIRDPIAREITYTKREIMLNSANIYSTVYTIKHR
jgi:hypothetical protein